MKASLTHYLEERRQKVEAFLEAHFRGDRGGLPILREAMCYSLMAGGKRLRPILVIAAAESCLKDPASALDIALPTAAAIEMIHTYSLIHDDLPAMDNDDLRRGRPTSHKKFGEAVAILAGDALLTDAFGLIAAESRVSASIILAVIRDIADAAGSGGMALGQAKDLAVQGKKITPADLEDLHRHKTGRLIEVSVTSGAKLAGADRPRLEAAGRYGRAIGLAFQIVDDILDVEGASEKMGKRVGGDERKEKATYPSILGLEESRGLAGRLAKEAIAALEGFANADPLRGIAGYIVDRTS